jgi:hypothetical protein
MCKGVMSASEIPKVEEGEEYFYIVVWEHQQNDVRRSSP